MRSIEEKLALEKISYLHFETKPKEKLGTTE